MKRVLYSMIFLLCGTLFATDIVWIELRPEFNYQDFEYACETDPFLNPSHLVAEIDNGKILRARLSHSDTSLSGEQTLALEPSEYENISFNEKSDAKLWIETLPVSERMIRWLVSRPYSLMPGCSLKKKLVTMEPNTFVFHFDVSDLDKVPYKGIASELAVIHGKHEKGGAYKLTLRLHQKPIGRE